MSSSIPVILYREDDIIKKSFFHKEKNWNFTKRKRGKEKIIGETMSSSIPVILYREDDIIKKSFFHKEKKRKRGKEKRENNRRNDVLIYSCNTLQGR